MKHVQTARKCDCGKGPKWLRCLRYTLGKKTRPLQWVSNFNSPMSPPWRHPFLRNRSLVPWHPFFQRSKSHVICNGFLFTKIPRQAGGAHFLCAGFAVAYRASTHPVRAKKGGSSGLCRKGEKNGDSHPGSQSTMMSRWIRSNFIKKLCYTSLYHRLDEEIIITPVDRQIVPLEGFVHPRWLVGFFPWRVWSLSWLLLFRVFQVAGYFKIPFMLMLAW